MGNGCKVERDGEIAKEAATKKETEDDERAEVREERRTVRE